ncbi:TetR-like C-terminal domain-containing protein [Paenibacillus sp. LHD-117]|uniref:TetR-like C-terminal domain-containing protein n=1 Tax=Paenibacillus sp. LHD-117 TaxID=3071412 RepID=UPI0027DF3EA7|nr:TetR-like C-terminal domain-containing protein [Paenibacillus sp. LHD-117]MDQ6423406.1 TetR-like C-terminal domain-containing protein [Paenibacillus sp. LHD-117]
MKKRDPRQVHSIKKMHHAYLSLQLKETENITIQRLCEEAKVTRPTFYRSYKDTVELRIDLHTVILKDLKQSLTIKNPKRIDELRPDDLPENMVSLFDHIFQNQLAYDVLLIYKPDELFIKEMKGILRQFVEDGIRVTQTTEEGLRMDMSFVIAYTLGAFLESIVWWIMNNYNYPAETMAAKLLEISFHGPYKNPILWHK